MKILPFQLGRRLFFRKYMRAGKRLGHMVIGSEGWGDTRDLYRWLLKEQASRPGSSIILTGDPYLRQELASIPFAGKNVLHFDPERPDTVSINPLFHREQSPTEWLVDFFCGEPVFNPELLMERIIMKRFFDHGRSHPYQDATLRDVYLWTGMRPAALKEEILRRRPHKNDPLLLELTRTSPETFAKTLPRIHRRLELFEDRRVHALFSRPTLYVPLFLQEPTILIAHVPPTWPEAQTILRLALYSMVLQVLSAPPQHGETPLSIFTEGMIFPERYLLKALFQREVGVTLRRDKFEGNELDYFGRVLIVLKNSALFVRAGKGTKRLYFL